MDKKSGSLPAWEIVAIGDTALAYRSMGTGAPAVVLEMGLGASGSLYDEVAQAIAVDTRVVWYDRAGLGRSRAAPKPRTVADLALDLHRLLDALEVPRPVILVGHSLGGLTVRWYRQQYPNDVAALVLVDASHEDQRDRLLANLPPATPGEPGHLSARRRALTAQWEDPGANDEGIDNLTNTRLMHAVRPLGDLPLYVISRGKPPATVPEGMAAIVACDEAQWRRMQEDLVRLSRRAHHVIAEASGHMVQRDQPSVIVETVGHAVHESRLAGAAG